MISPEISTRVPAFLIQQMPYPVTVPADRDAMVERLRCSLLASTPGSGYRHDSPPSSAASSCGIPENDDDGLGEEDDLPISGPASFEWEAWIDWDRAVTAMRVED